MKLSLSWLREWVDPGVPTEELVSQLTNAGIEVEGVEAVAGDLGAVVVGEVQSVEPHPQAERLHVCRVGTDGQAVSVVCGAPNVYPGMRAPLALPGAQLPNGVKVERTRFRGVESQGMLCSPRELGLGEYADGLMDLGPEAPPGRSLVEWLALADVSLDLAITPNRGDCLSVAGIAREVGVRNRTAVAGVPLQPVAAVLDDTFPVALDAPADCPRYVGRIIRNVDPTARTPIWMQERLRRSGLRSISPVVDVTNYVMLELGQPMHAFDLERLERGIRVRRAHTGERLVLLDERELELDPETLVIADEVRPVALAGIMGGLDSSVQATTRHIFLESAFFAPRFLAGEARRFGLQTDSSYRFERGVAPDLQRDAAERATKLLLDIVGGEPGPVAVAEVAADVPQRSSIRLRAARTRLLLGMDVAAGEVEDVLRRLGMAVQAEAGGWVVTPPPFRFDITIEADLIEEIARITGYDRVPSVRPHADLEIVTREPEARVAPARIRETLVERGYREAITYSFVDPRLQETLAPGNQAPALANPISAEMAVMRASLWPGLVQAYLYNVNRQQEEVRLFELGRAYLRRNGVMHEEAVIGGLAAGLAHGEHWALPRRLLDFFDIKADVEALLALGGTPGEFDFVPATPAALHPGQAARIERNGREVGLVGRLHPRIGAELKAPGPVYLFELRTEVLVAAQLPHASPISRYPGVRRDIAIVIDESVPAGTLRATIGQAAPDVLQDFQLFDVYRGEGIDSGKKSLAFSLTFQAVSRTLSDEEIDAFVAVIVGALRREFDATLRG